jgi:hypothetical protein
MSQWSCWRDRCLHDTRLRSRVARRRAWRRCVRVAFSSLEWPIPPSRSALCLRAHAHSGWHYWPTVVVGGGKLTVAVVLAHPGPRSHAHTRDGGGSKSREGLGGDVLYTGKDKGVQSRRAIRQRWDVSSVWLASCVVVYLLTR